MRKFISFLFLLFPLLCYAQSKNVAARGAAPSKTSTFVQATTALPQRPKAENNFVKQQPSRPNNYQVNYSSANVASNVYQEKNNTSKEENNIPAPVVTKPAPVVKEPIVPAAVEQQPTVKQPASYKEPQINLQQEKPAPIDNSQTQKEKKPSAPSRPPMRPGNYVVVDWTNFIDTSSHREREWASKVLDTKNLSLDGRCVQVAVLDSGIQRHKQFDGANIEVLDITGQNNPLDSCGHGTAVAGIIVGRSANDFRGIAPAVNLKSFKIADESGTTNNNYIIQALQSILDYNIQNPSKKINIVNISYGLELDNFEMKNKLAEVYSSGVAIISASGNDGRQGLLYPAAYNFVFAAGAIDKNKNIAPFSNWGQGLDFVLPGSGLMTLGLNNDYVWVKGTSFSSAYLTGVAALATQAFKEKYGRLPSPQELYEVLQKISTPVRFAPSIKQGFGVPDASKIVSYI